MVMPPGPEAGKTELTRKRALDELALAAAFLSKAPNVRQCLR